MARTNTPSTSLPPSLLSFIESSRKFASASRAENTKRAYRASWNDFTTWCTIHSLPSLPATPETVTMYMSDQADRYKVGTLGHRLAAIAVAHKMAGHPNPASKQEEPLNSVWAGINRLNKEDITQKAPLLEPHLRKIVQAMPETAASPVKTLRTLRDKAVLLFGFAGALRRSEITALRVQNLTFDDRGIRVRIARSKTDVDGKGEWIGIPATGTATCPVGALKAWLKAAEIEDGFVFRAVRHGGIVTDSLSTKVVSQIVKKYAKAIGLDQDVFSGHSLRAGLITQAAQSGARENDIMRHSRHKSVPVLRQYVRKATVWDDNAAAKAFSG